RARVEGAELRFGSFALPVPPDPPAAAGEGAEVILGIRPSDFQDADVWTSDLPVMEVTAEVIEELGSEVNVIFAVDAPPVVTEDTVSAASADSPEEDLTPLGLVAGA